MSEFDDWKEEQERIHNDYDAENAWYAGQQSQQAKIDELQARIDGVLKACDNLRTDLIRENHVEYDKGWKDCATSIYYHLKGNKDETIEQINRNDIGVHKSILNRVVVLSQYDINYDKNTISIDMQGAAQLIKVLQGWIDEN